MTVMVMWQGRWTLMWRVEAMMMRMMLMIAMMVMYYRFATGDCCDDSGGDDAHDGGSGLCTFSRCLNPRNLQAF